MGEVKHTPGPWSVPHFARPDVNCECGYVLTDHLMGAVCTVYASGEGNDWRNGDNPKFEEAVANAHLIASAPDMLAALRAMVARMELYAGPDGIHAGEQDKALLIQANAAIAAAEGR